MLVFIHIWIFSDELNNISFIIRNNLFFSSLSLIFSIARWWEEKIKNSFMYQMALASFFWGFSMHKFRSKWFFNSIRVNLTVLLFVLKHNSTIFERFWLKGSLKEIYHIWVISVKNKIGKNRIFIFFFFLLLVFG